MKISNKKSAIGLVLDSTELRAVEVAFAPTVHAVACGSVTLPEGLVKDGLITDLFAAGALLSEMLRERGFSDAPFILGAKNENMLLRSASLPRVPDEKMRAAVMLQAQQFIPVPVRELVLDYVFCAQTEQDDHPMAEILLVGAKKNYIANLIQLVKAAGGTVAGIDSALLAMVRMEGPCEETRLLAEVDHDAVSIAFVNQGRILLTRSVRHGNSIAEQETLSEEESEKVAASIAEDIRTSMLYFNNLNVGKIVEEAVLTGPISNLESLAKKIGDKLSLTVSVPTAYAGVEGISPDNLYKYSTCISLAMGVQEEKFHNIVSLLPEEFRKEQEQNKKLVGICKKMVIAAVVVLTVLVGVTGAKIGSNAKVVALQNQRTQLENQCIQLAEFETLYQQKDALEKKLAVALSSDEQWLAAFKEVTDSLPKGVWVENAAAEKREDGSLQLKLYCNTLTYNGVAETLASVAACDMVTTAVCDTVNEATDKVSFALTLSIVPANER